MFESPPPRMIRSGSKISITLDNDSAKLLRNAFFQLAKFGLMASMASVVGSLYIYFVGDNEMLGIFVGLWAPTLILATKEIEEWLNN